MPLQPSVPLVCLAVVRCGVSLTFMPANTGEGAMKFIAEDGVQLLVTIVAHCPNQAFLLDKVCTLVSSVMKHDGTAAMLALRRGMSCSP